VSSTDGFRAASAGSSSSPCAPSTVVPSARLIVFPASRFFTTSFRPPLVGEVEGSAGGEPERDGGRAMGGAPGGAAGGGGPDGGADGLVAGGAPGGAAGGGGPPAARAGDKAERWHQTVAPAPASPRTGQ